VPRENVLPVNLGEETAGVAMAYGPYQDDPGKRRFGDLHLCPAFASFRADYSALVETVEPRRGSGGALL
jgi:hypothetical protein